MASNAVTSDWNEDGQTINVSGIGEGGESKIDPLAKIDPKILFWWENKGLFVRIDKNSPASIHNRRVKGNMYNPFTGETQESTNEVKVVYGTFYDAMDPEAKRYRINVAQLVPV